MDQRECCDVPETVCMCEVSGKMGSGDCVHVRLNSLLQILFVIKEPDVFKTNADNPKSPATYVVFGKAEIEDLSAQATSAAVEQFKAPGAGLEVCCLLYRMFHIHVLLVRLNLMMLIRIRICALL